jgi:hypothetical protein
MGLYAGNKLPVFHGVLFGFINYLSQEVDGVN